MQFLLVLATSPVLSIHQPRFLPVGVASDVLVFDVGSFFKLGVLLEGPISDLEWHLSEGVGKLNEENVIFDNKVNNRLYIIGNGDSVRLITPFPPADGMSS